MPVACTVATVFALSVAAPVTAVTTAPPVLAVSAALSCASTPSEPPVAVANSAALPSAPSAAPLPESAPPVLITVWLAAATTTWSPACTPTEPADDAYSAA